MEYHWFCKIRERKIQDCQLLHKFHQSDFTTDISCPKPTYVTIIFFQQQSNGQQQIKYFDVWLSQDILISKTGIRTQIKLLLYECKLSEIRKTTVYCQKRKLEGCNAEIFSRISSNDILTHCLGDKINRKYGIWMSPRLTGEQYPM